MKSKSTKKAPAKSKVATANGASTKPKKGKAAPMAHEEEEDQVDYQKIVHEVHGNPDDKKRVEHWEPIECPYCGESFEIHFENAEDGQTMYEDCRVCCKPISLHVQVEDEDVHVSVARA